MYILGINAYHGGASACLIRDGELIAAAEEERFKRIKYWAGFPVQAIRYCLEEAGITPYNLDHIGISRDPNANLRQKVLFALRRRPNFGFIRDRLNNMARSRDAKTVFCQALEVTGLRQFGVKAEHLPTVVAKCRKASSTQGNPIELSGAELGDILREAILDFGDQRHRGP